jgi:lipopolysaccharide export system protein LptC
LSPNQPQAPGVNGFNMGGLLAGSSQATDMISVPNATVGVTNASFNPQAQALSVDTPVNAAGIPSEVAAQDMASGAVNEVMSLQNKIRENRGMPLLVE